MFVVYSSWMTTISLTFINTLAKISILILQEQYKFIYSCLEHVKTHRPTEIKPSLADPPTTTPTNSPPSSESSSNDIPVTPSEH